MPVNQCDGLRQDQRLHGHGVGPRNAYGHKSLPCAARLGWPLPDGLQQPGGKMQHRLHGRRPDVRLKQCRRMRNDRDRGAFPVDRQRVSLVVGGQKIGGRHVLRRQNPV